MGSGATHALAFKSSRRTLSVRAAASVPKEVDVVVVGAGIAGLACAVTLQQQGLKPIVLETADAVGE